MFAKIFMNLSDRQLLFWAYYAFFTFIRFLFVYARTSLNKN